jgi:hypothetical protein
VLDEEPRLLGVAAEGRGDDEVDAVGVRRGGHAVEREGDVGPHRLSLTMANGPRYSPALSSPTAMESRTVTRARTGASPPPGKATLMRLAPLRAALLVAASGVAVLAATQRLARRFAATRR